MTSAKSCGVRDLAAVEDDVLHRPAAQVPRALLAHAPANRVDDVRLAAPVGAHDPQNVVVEVQHRAIDERLEADELELLDLHPCVDSKSGVGPITSDTGSVALRRAGQKTDHVTAHIVTVPHHLYPRSLVQFKQEASVIEREWGRMRLRRPGVYLPSLRSGSERCPAGVAAAGSRLDRVPGRPYPLCICRPTSTRARLAATNGNRFSESSKPLSKCARSARNPRPTD